MNIMKGMTETEVATLLRARLSSSVAEFEFIKRDGTHRHAFGTTVPNLVKEHVVGGEGPANVISFWDVEIGAWRSVRPRTIISIVL